jgi:hypothetical protein
LWLSHGIPSYISRKLEADINNGGWETIWVYKFLSSVTLFVDNDGVISMDGERKEHEMDGTIWNMEAWSGGAGCSRSICDLNRQQELSTWWSLTYLELCFNEGCHMFVMLQYHTNTSNRYIYR